MGFQYDDFGEGKIDRSQSCKRRWIQRKLGGDLTLYLALEPLAADPVAAGVTGISAAGSACLPAEPALDVALASEKFSEAELMQ